MHTLPSLIMWRRAGLVVSLALVLAPLAGCQRPAPAGRYEKDGVAFDHLAGWSVARDTKNKARTIVVEGPEHAVFTVSVFDPGLDVSLATFVTATTKARAAAVKGRLSVGGLSFGAEADATPATAKERSILGAKVSGLEQHFAMELLNARVPHTVEFFLTTIGGHPVIFMDQASDKHRGEVDAGFQKIYDTVAVGR